MRTIPDALADQLLAVRLATGLSLPSVKPWENTFQPRAEPYEWWRRPASRGPLVLANQTCSAISVRARNNARVTLPTPSALS